MSPLARAPYSPRRNARPARSRSARRRVDRARRAHRRGDAGVGGEARETCTGAGQAQRLLADREGRRRQGRRRLRRRPLADRAQHRRQQRPVARGRLQAVLQQPDRPDLRPRPQRWCTRPGRAAVDHAHHAGHAVPGPEHQPRRPVPDQRRGHGQGWAHPDVEHLADRESRLRFRSVDAHRVRGQGHGTGAHPRCRASSSSPTG